MNDIIEINGVKISGAMLALILNDLTRPHPNPKRWFRYERQGDIILCHVKTDE